MKLATAVFALAFGSLAMAAQSPGPVQLMARRGVDVSAGCPVAMHLDQSVMGAAAHVKTGQSAMPLRTRLHLVLSGAPEAKVHPAQIQEAGVTVYGYDTTPHFKLTSPAQGKRSVPAKRMTVKFVPQSDGSAEANFAVAGLPWASLLEINSITFANGNTWKPAPGRTCTVTPDPIVLVADQQH